MSANPSQVHTPQCSPYGAWIRDLPELARTYQTGRPVPHIYLTELLDADFVRGMAREFPSGDLGMWTRYRHYNENKFGLTNWKLFPRALQQAVLVLNSPFFVSLMSRLTGIPDLLPDPSLEGGGLHFCRRGGYLNLHSDFSVHHYNEGWRRRVNLILYLNPRWHDAWGGAIEFWDQNAKTCFVKYPPRLNHAVIFNTDAVALHGFPDPVTCPENETRKSLALYYYTTDGESYRSSSTQYYARSDDRAVTKLFVWLDKKVLSLYSLCKTRFKFSDRFASGILRLFSGK